MTGETPILSEMGIRNPSQIVDHWLVRVADYMDVRKINYGRPRGSSLAKRRSYEFKRSGKPIAVSDEAGAIDLRLEISPLHSDALVELDHLQTDRKAAVVTKQIPKEEITAFSKEMNARLAQLPKAINSLE